MKELGLASADALDHHALRLGDCGEYVPTQVCLGLPWDSPQNE